MSEAIPLVLVGAGGTASDVLCLIEACNSEEDAPRYVVKGLLDDRSQGQAIAGQPVLGGLKLGQSLQKDIPNLHFVDCLGSPSSHMRRPDILSANGLDDAPFASLIHPSAVCAPDLVLGAGCLIFANATLLSGVALGQHVTILSNCVLNHGVDIGDFAILASNVCLSGEVHVGARAYIGCGANVKERIKIGQDALVGLGSAVIRDVEAGTTVVGVPAKPICRPS